MAEDKKAGGGKNNGSKGRNEWVELIRELLPLIFLSGGGFLKSCSARGCILLLMMLTPLTALGGWIFWVVTGSQGRAIGIAIMVGSTAALGVLIWLFGQTSKIQDVEILQEAFAEPVQFSQPDKQLPVEPVKQITRYDEGGEEIAPPKEIEGEYKRIDEREIDV